MHRFRITMLLAVILAMSFCAIPYAEQKGKEKEKPPSTIGKPDCPNCNGTGIVTPQTLRKKSARKKQTVMYCFHKAAGKRCNVLIGGWEPCENCADLPTMARVFREHDAVIGYYREHESLYDVPKNELGFKFNLGEGVHFRLMSNCSHEIFHGTIEALELSWDIFAEEWGFLTKDYLAKQPYCFEEPGADLTDEEITESVAQGLMWDTQWRSSPQNIFIVQNKEEYLKFVEWYYNHPSTSKGNDALRIWKQCAAIGVSNPMPRGRFTYWREELETHCSLVHNAGHEYLREVGCNKLPHWINEGFAKYMEYRTKNATLTHCIEYGAGTKVDEDWQDSSSWKNKLKEASIQPSSYNEQTRKWVGLIPMDIMMRYRIENISWQGMAQSWGLVCYLMGEGQTANVKKAHIEKFKLLARGLSGTERDPEKQEAVFKEVYGMSSADVFEKWRAWLKKW